MILNNEWKLRVYAVLRCVKIRGYLPSEVTRLTDPWTALIARKQFSCNKAISIEVSFIFLSQDGDVATTFGCRESMVQSMPGSLPCKI